MAESDRRALAMLLLFLVASFMYMATTWSFRFRQQSIDKFEQNLLLMPLLYEAKSKTTALKDTGKLEGMDQALLTLVSSTAKEQKITFKRFQPEGEKVLKLWIEDTSFNSLLLWLHKIDKKNGISVQDIAVEQTKELGYVDVRLTLVR